MKKLLYLFSSILAMQSAVAAPTTVSDTSNVGDSTEVLDVFLDLAFTFYDIYDVVYQSATGGEVTTSVCALGADFACVFVPFMSGGGGIVRGGAKALDEVAVIAAKAPVSTRKVTFTWSKQTYEGFRDKALYFHSKSSTFPNKSKFWFDTPEQFDDMLADALTSLKAGDGIAVSQFSKKYGMDAVHAVIQLPSAKYGKDCYVKMSLNPLDEWMGTIHPINKDIANKTIGFFKDGTYVIP